jgi:hypothetical protein
MEKEIPGVQIRPSLAALGADRTAPSIQEKKNTPRRQAPAKKDPPPEALKFVAGQLPGAKFKDNKAGGPPDQRAASAWSIIWNFKNMFPDLDYSQMPHSSASAELVERYVEHLSGQIAQLGNNKKPGEVWRQAYLTTLDFAVRGYYGILQDPLKIQIHKLPDVAQKVMNESGWCETEFMELQCRYPLLSQSHPLMRIALNTVFLAKEVDRAARTNQTFQSAGNSVPKNVAEQFKDL